MIRLHHVPLSRSFRVIWLLEELGLDYEVSSYSIRDGSLRDPAFLKLSPAGRVPALEYHGEVLFESAAIAMLLCERHTQPRLQPPPGDPERSDYLQLMAYSETLGCLLENLNLNRVFLRPPAKASPEVIRLLTARLQVVLESFEQRLAGSHLLRSGFSTVDIMIAYGFRLARYYVDFAQFPKLIAYLDLLMARPAYVRADARDGEQDFYARDFYPLPEV